MPPVTFGSALMPFPLALNLDLPFGCAQDFPEGEPRQIQISGTPDAVGRAVKMVKELIEGEPGSAQAIIQKVYLHEYYAIMFWFWFWW